MYIVFVFLNCVFTGICCVYLMILIITSPSLYFCNIFRLLSFLASYIKWLSYCILLNLFPQLNCLMFCHFIIPLTVFVYLVFVFLLLLVPDNIIMIIVLTVFNHEIMQIFILICCHSSHCTYCSY